MEINQLAEDLIFRIEKFYPGSIQLRYKGASTLEEIAIKRGFVLQKGEIDYDRTASTILNEFRSGRLGKMTIEDL